MPQVQPSRSIESLDPARSLSAPRLTCLPCQRTPRPASAAVGKTATIYCEANFGGVDGKTANGLVRHSEKYEILSVIDSAKTGFDAHEVLGHPPEGVPVCRDLDHAIALAGRVPDYLIFGIAPASGRLSSVERRVILDAMQRGMHVVSGLHEFLNDDAEFSAASDLHNVTILDVRRPRNRKDLQTFSGRISTIPCPRVAVMGTDCAIGKRTTATILTRALNDLGIRAVLVGTGQTGLIQGARHGVALDAVPSQFCAGEMEAAIVEAYDAEHPDVIIVEGQGALSHPAYLTSGFILRGSQPQGVILQHAPARRARVDFPDAPMPEPASEIRLIETFSDTRVIGLTINHEHLTEADLSAAIARYAAELAIPVTDAIARPVERLVDMVLAALPQLRPNSPITATHARLATARARMAEGTCGGGPTMTDMSLSAQRLATPASAACTGATDSDTIVGLLAARDDASITQLEHWLKANSRTFAPVVAQSAQAGNQLSPEAARAVVDALVCRAPASGESSIRVLVGCLDVMAGRINESLDAHARSTAGESADALVCSAVATLTSNRPARHSETAIRCLSGAGPGGALVLARAFDAVRRSLKLRIVRSVQPSDVLALDDNVVASLAHSLSRLVQDLDGQEKEAVARLLESLCIASRAEPSEVGPAERLTAGDRLFHASWGAGTVVSANDDEVTVDFGSAGTRTLLRTLARLQHAQGRHVPPPARARTTAPEDDHADAQACEQSPHVSRVRAAPTRSG